MTKKIVKRTGGGLTVPGGAASKVAARLKAKQDRALAAAAQFDRFALFDGSGSMSTADATGPIGEICSRWEALKAAWFRLAPKCEGRLAAYVFGSGLHPVKGSASGQVVDLIPDGGGTQMSMALRAMQCHRHPNLRSLLVSDGRPTDGDPVGTAVALGCAIDTVYVGPDDEEAKDVLRRVAVATGGEFRDMAGQFDATKFLEHAIRVLQLES